MSTYMVNNRTLTKIAKYMEVCANRQADEMPWLSDLELGDGFVDLLLREGCGDAETGKVSAALIHAFLYRRNREALMLCYGKEFVEKEMCPEEQIAMEDGGTAIDISSANCKEWLANLYTVCECYLYQIEEGKFWHDRLYQEFGRWILQMAGVLARYVVKEVRGIYPLDPNSKPSDEF